MSTAAIETGGTFELACRLRNLPQHQQARSDQSPRRGICGLKPDSFAELRNCSFVVSALLINNAEIVVDERNPASLPQYRLKDLLGFIKTARLQGFDPAGEDFLHAKAKIVYVQPNLGSGVSFLEVEQKALAVLGRWLEMAQKDGQKRSG